MELSPHANPIMDSLFVWEPDAERLEKEVAHAETEGRRDELSLAEIQCSIDLIDSELATLRGQTRNEPDPRPQVHKLVKVRERLASLAARLLRLPA